MHSSLVSRCFINTYGPGGNVVQYIILATSIIAAVLNIVFYGITWYEMRSVELKLKKGQQSNGGTTSGPPKSHSSARIMMAFVLAYLCQMTIPYVLLTWALVETPPSPLVATGSWTIFLGGMINGCVYMVIRRKLLAHKIQDSSSGVPTSLAVNQRH